MRLYDMTRQPPARRADLTHARKLPVGIVLVPPRYFTDVAFTPDGRRVVAIASSTIAIWDRATGTEVESLDSINFGPGRIDISPDGRRLAVTQGQMGILEIPRPQAP